MTESNDSKALFHDALKGIISRLEKTENFVLDQAPDICKQMITEQSLYNWFEFGKIAAFFVLAVGLEILFIYWVLDANESNKMGLYALIFFIGIFLMIFTAVLIDSIGDIIRLKRCPKPYLLREFKSLLE